MRRITVSYPRGGSLKNKAFTLIELLAVIIIIGVIALIVSPMIIRTIQKSRKSTFERSIDGLIDNSKITIGGDTLLSILGTYRVTSTATDNSNLSSFTYEVIKNNVSQGVKSVTVSGKSGSVNIPLNVSGTYKIKLKATDQYGNTTGVSPEFISGEYKIDVDKPTAGTALCNRTACGTDETTCSGK